MKITDAAVFPYPCGDTSVGRLAIEAKTLGFDSLVAIDTPAGSFDGVEILCGIILPAASVRDIITRVKRSKDSATVISVLARDNGFNRAAIGLKGVHILRGLQTADKNAFDHVTAKMAADNGVAIDIDLSALIAGRGIARQRAIQRYRDIMTFERRFEFPLTLSTYARSYLDLRAVREITGLGSLFGMDIPDVEKALGTGGLLTAPSVPSVRVIA
ncbi:MAG TPA: RNase P subunit p30 family protein [Methanoregula sp.]|nr:RNase P subunit p30 family protein [Methanoregula sp.]